MVVYIQCFYAYSKKRKIFTEIKQYVQYSADLYKTSIIN